MYISAAKHNVAFQVALMLIDIVCFLMDDFLRYMLFDALNVMNLSMG